jgi:hypothetical protein
VKRATVTAAVLLALFVLVFAVLLIGAGMSK